MRRDGASFGSVQPPCRYPSNAVPRSSEGHDYRGPIADGHWVDAADLKPGYRLLNDDESWAEVVSVEVETKALKACNLTVADFQTYFVKEAANDDAEPVWVHNACRFFKTAKEATDAARRLGFTKTNFISRGQPVYRKGNRYISPDVDGHKLGGVWKMANSVKNLGRKNTRSGTYDRNLNRIGN